MTLNPPFRADHVGSLLRTEEVKINRARWKNGEISAKTLHVIENRNIGETVKKLESIGIQSITDGEFRRDYFHLDFLKELEGKAIALDAYPDLDGFFEDLAECYRMEIKALYEAGCRYI